MSNFKRLLVPLVLAAAVMVAPAAMAQDAVRIGFVNTDRLLSEAAPAKAAQVKLEREFLQREKELDNAAQALQVASDKFQRESLTMSESQRNTEQRRLMDQDRDFQRRRREFQEDLNARKQEELENVLELANRVVEQVAKAERFDAILQEAVYVDPRVDITDKVLRALNNAK